MDRRQFLRNALGVLGAAAAGSVLPPWAQAGAAGNHHKHRHHKPAPTTTTLPADTTTSPGGLVAPWIQAENAQPGTSAWVLSNANGLIQGFADATSVNRGEKVGFKVTCAAPTYRVEAYRMGWYQGLGARLVSTSDPQTGLAQDPARVVFPLNMVDASHWETTYELTLDDNYPPGCYLFRLVGENGSDWHVPLTVRDDASRARFLMVNGVSEWQAYNEYGGYSLYFGRGSRGRNFESRARVVSFDRPYALGAGSGDFIGLEHPLVMRLEEQGFDVTYATSIDLHTKPDMLQQHTAFLSPGHDEYWSAPMRDGAEKARDAGVNLAFFGANAAYRQVRFEDSSVGANRHQVCYKSAAEDPMTKVNPALSTVNWRDAPVSRPEMQLVGVGYDGNPVKADLVIADPGAWVFEGLGFRAGQVIGPDVIGPEFDRAFPGSSPKNLQVLAHSPVRVGRRASFADTSYYSSASGAGVFASASIWWLTKLSPPRVFAASPYIPEIVEITLNVLRAFGEGPAGEKYPSQGNAPAVAGAGGPNPNESLA
jgi:hypothetical protein